MKTLPLVVSVTVLALGGAAVAAAEPKTGPANAGASHPILDDAVTNPPASAPPPAVTPRTVSATTAARLAEMAPKFTPPPPNTPTASNPVLKDTDDKPRNGIVRLPAYLVREPKMPTLNEVQVLTPKGRVELAYKAFPGLRFGNLWIFRNDGIANAMLEEELTLARAREIADLMTLLPTGPESNSPRDRLIRDALAPRSSPTQMDAGGDQ